VKGHSPHVPVYRKTGPILIYRTDAREKPSVRSLLLSIYVRGKLIHRVFGPMCPIFITCFYGAVRIQ
jgi:hypothetical protein